jgi:ribosomal protein L2
MRKFSRSLGSYATVLRKNLRMLSVIIKLPSGVRKIFSFFSLCSTIDKAYISPNFVWSKKNYIKSLAPRSRGVAKNPVDHPHGGRTKSIKYPRTP